MSAAAIAAYGMISAANRFDLSAAKTVNGLTSEDPSVDPVTEVVNQSEASTDFEANAKTFAVANKMMGALLDIKV